MSLASIPALTPKPVAGDPAPSFIQRTPGNPRFTLDAAAGRYLVLGFIGSASSPEGRNAVPALLARPDLFNDQHAAAFVISQDPTDEIEERVANRTPGFRVFWDFDYTAARAYRLAPPDKVPVQGWPALPRFWIVIDPTMRVIANIAMRPDGSDLPELLDLVAGLPAPDAFAGQTLQAPILFLPRVFEPELCAHLIGLYETNGGAESGFMRQIDGKTVGVMDANFKRRKDYDIADQELIRAIQSRFLRRVIPEIAKVHQFHATRMERHIVSCYAAEDGGHFAAHRDNTTTGTAHRRFAVSINLNDDFDGGEVSFPEYGRRSFKAPPGGAVVFSCGLLHQVSRVTRGRRFAFLPFLYDEAAAKIRAQNQRTLGENNAYQAAASETGTPDTGTPDAEAPVETG